MERLSTSKAPTESFSILLQYSDGGIKHKHRLKIVLICIGILLTLTLLGIITGLSVHLNSKSSIEKLTQNSSHSNETLLLIGGKNSQNEFLNEIEVIGQEGCSRLQVLPTNDRNRESLSTLTNGGYLVICTEHLESIFCHASNGTSMKQQVPDLALANTFFFSPGALSSSTSIISTHFRKDFHGITINNDFIILKTEKGQKGRGQATYKKSIFRADTNSFLKIQSSGISPLLNAYYEAQGSCSVTIPNTNFFLMIGGYNGVRGDLVTTQVSIFKYNDGHVSTPRFAKGKKMPQLRIGRKMPGCALVKFGNKLTVVVAGGEDSNGKKLKNVEILQFDGSDNYSKILEAMIRSSWTEMPKLKFARSNFPSVGNVEGLLTVTAGDMDSSDPDAQVSVEQFDEDLKSWIVRQDTQLKSPRFGHSTLKINKEWCDG